MFGSKIKVLRIWLIFAGLLGMPGYSDAGNRENGDASGPLRFKRGERVVFLGNSIFENELQWGYLEFAMATRWPDLELSFRNLGWTGDNVYGEARSTFTNPPTAYQLLMQQITDAKPNTVFIAYGGVESQWGEEGLTRFREGLHKIIDTVEALGAETVLLSTIPVRLAGTPENTEVQNRNLKRYASEVAAIAASRKKRFIDIYQPVLENKGDIYTDNGIHLSETGYRYLARVVEKELGWPDRSQEVVIHVGKQGPSGGESAQVIPGGGGVVTFTWAEKLLPYPLPVSADAAGEGLPLFKITGLKGGIYTLSEDGRQLHTASAEAWGQGIAMNHGVSLVQSGKIREYIVRKNDLFFQQYRPLNRTYILGFRSYEQGRHKQGLQDLNFIITWLEGQINLQRTPVIKTYQLNRIK